MCGITTDEKEATDLEENEEGIWEILRRGKGRDGTKISKMKKINNIKKSDL